MQSVLGYIILREGKDDIKNRCFTGPLIVTLFAEEEPHTALQRSCLGSRSKGHLVFLILQADAPFQLLCDFFFFVFLNIVLL